jgi:hypothetical protein
VNGRSSKEGDHAVRASSGSKQKHLTRTAGFTTKAALELVASAIPGIGGTIATAIAMLETEKVSRRLGALMQEVHQLYAGIQTDKLDRDYVQSEAFEEVVMAAIEAGRRSSSREKRRMVAATLVGTVTIDRPPGLDVEALLDMLGGLSSEDLRVARLLYRGVDRTAGGIVGGAVPPTDVPDVDFHVARLVAAGLFVGRGPMSDFAIQQMSYFPTETLERLIQLLLAGGLDEFVK